MKLHLVLLGLVVSGCAGSGIAGTVTEGTLPVVGVTIEVVDEEGEPITEALLSLSDQTRHSVRNGILELDLDGPVAGVLSADGMLDQPMVLDHERDARVTMLARFGPDGTTRRSFHFGGDTMFARRYFGSGTSREKLAQGVVASVKDLFGASDHSTLNLESVVGTLPDEVETPGKRWAIQSVPETTSLLAHLGVDLVTLGNNHIGDYDDEGVRSTLDHLDQAGVPSVGAALTESEAAHPFMYDVEGLRVSTASYLLSAGDANNDHLPLTGDDEFAGEDERLEWQYEYRDVDLVGPISSLDGRYRAGDVWAWFEENAGGADSEAELWLRAESYFPELQDFGARRAHGGAALHSEESVEAALTSNDAELEIVQLHGGFQYQVAPSRGMVDAAKHAIDNGADLVIAHHPHVLGGFEYYGDGLIIWSLGNFVFDQDLFVTYRSGFARMVYEGTTLIDASLIPLYLVDYRPVPAAGPAALRTAAHLTTLSSNDTVTIGVEDGDPAQSVRAPAGDRGSVRLRDDGSIVLLDAPPPTRRLTMPESGQLTLDPHLALVNPGDADFEIGRDLFGWGAFEQTLADGDVDRAPMWHLDGADGFWWNTRGDDGHLVFDPSSASIGRIRTTSRIPLTPSGLVDRSGKPLQSMPRIEVRLTSSASWLTSFSVRIDTYHFSDRNPARYPVNERISTQHYEMSIGRAQSIDIAFDVPESQLLDPATGLEATAMMLYIENPTTRLGTLEVDDVAVIEWRQANEFLYRSIIDADHVSGPPGSEIEVVDLRP